MAAPSGARRFSRFALVAVGLVVLLSAVLALLTLLANSPSAVGWFSGSASWKQSLLPFRLALYLGLYFGWPGLMGWLGRRSGWEEAMIVAMKARQWKVGALCVAYEVLLVQDTLAVPAGWVG